MATKKKARRSRPSPSKKLSSDGKRDDSGVKAEGIHKKRTNKDSHLSAAGDPTQDNKSARLGLGRDEKSGKVIFFEHYRVIEKGMNSGYLEVKRGKSGALALIPPNGILRWPRDSEPLTKKQLDLMDDTKQALKALASSKRKGKK
jgi:hypothetical protein